VWLFFYAVQIYRLNKAENSVAANPRKEQQNENRYTRTDRSRNTASINGHADPGQW
jgi:hypothetical protein